MTDELRAPLVRSLQRLADDLAVERHGDPHVAFVVLVYPDREPAVVAIHDRQSGAHDLTVLVTRDGGEEKTEDRRERPGRFFTQADLSDAAEALGDAASGTRSFGYRADKAQKWGEHIGEAIRKGWENRRRYRAERELSKAANEAARPAICPYCKSRFTERGLPMHLATAAICSRKRAQEQKVTLGHAPSPSEGEK